MYVYMHCMYMYMDMGMDMEKDDEWFMCCVVKSCVSGEPIIVTTPPVHVATEECLSVIGNNVQNPPPK